MKVNQTSVLAICSGLVLFTLPTHSTATSTAETEKHALAACLVSEAGWNSPDDYSALLHTLAYRKRLPYWRSRPMLDLVRSYCQVLRHPRRQGGWILAWPLGEPQERPEGFPDGLDHRRYVRSWLAVQRTVDAFQQGRVAHRCNGVPHQWGAPTLSRPQWRRLNCGNTQNVFYEETR